MEKHAEESLSSTKTAVYTIDEILKPVESQDTLHTTDPGDDAKLPGPASLPRLTIREYQADLQPQGLARTLKRKLGVTGSLVIFLGSVVELAALGFLAFLWTGEGAPGGANASTAWRSIVLRGWITQAVTLSSVVLRAAVDLQSAVCTSLAAALMLEACEVWYRDVSLFSMARAINAGPWTIIYRVIQNPRTLFRSVPAVSISILFLSAVAVQFSSTLLVSDFRQQSLVQDPTFGVTPVLGTKFEMLGAAELAVWSHLTPVFPSFAEQPVRSPPLGDRLVDTGNITRVFLPYQPAKRQRLRSYDGVAFSYTSRTVCMAPRLIDAKYFAYEPTTPLSLDGTGYVIKGNVTLDPEALIELDIAPDFGTNVAFTCGVPLYTGPIYAWDVNSTVKAPKLNYNANSICFLDLFRAIRDERPFSFLIIRAENTGRFWGRGQSRAYNGTALDKPVRDGDWTTFKVDPEFTLSTSVCILQTDMGLTHAKIDSTADPEDVALDYDFGKESWNSPEVMRMVGLPDTTPPEQRGILSLREHTKVTQTEFEDMWMALRGDQGNRTQQELQMKDYQRVMHLNIQLALLSFSPHVNEITGTPKGLTTCAACTYYFQSEVAGQINPYWAVVFQDIVRQQGGHLAWAVHSLFFWAMQTIYYSALLDFDIGGNATVALSQPTVAPRAWSGLGVVAGLVGVNLLCALAITALFLRRTQYSFYGSCWHAVGQIVSPETSRILEHSRHRADYELDAMMSEHQMKYAEAGLFRPTGSDGVVMMRRARVVSEKQGRVQGEARSSKGRRTLPAFKEC